VSGSHEEARPDPIVDFAGGPGGSAVTDDIPQVTQELNGLNVNRDLVYMVLTALHYGAVNLFAPRTGLPRPRCSSGCIRAEYAP